MTNNEEIPEQPSTTSASQKPSSPVANSAKRFTMWMALAVLNLVALLAIVGSVKGYVMNRPIKWALAAASLSMFFASIGVVCYLVKWGLFIGKLPEAVLVGVVLIISVASLPIIMNPANQIAVSNTNLYFSAWLAFFAVIWIVGDLAKEMYGMDLVGVASPHVKSRRGKWYALIATSLIVMSASVRIFRAFPCSAYDIKPPICHKIEFAIAAGVIGVIFAVLGATLGMIKGDIARRFEWASSAVMVVIWSFGLGFITFGSGPGRFIGNLYFATWGSFALSVLLAAESVREYMALREQATSPGRGSGEDEENPNSADIQTSATPGMHPVDSEP